MECSCGMRFSLDSRPAGGAVFCPGCGRRHTLPPASSARRSGNTNAVLGFVLALLSFATCLLLAPFAVFFSAKGLRERDGQGFAIAGLVLGIFQSISLLFLVAYLVFMVVVVGGIGAALAAILAQIGMSAAREAELRMQTLAALEGSQAAIQAYYVEHEAWPQPDEGTRLIREHRDGWGRALRYQQSGQEHAVVSAGRDGHFGNDDDISQSWREDESGDAPEGDSAIPPPGENAPPENRGG